MPRHTGASGHHDDETSATPAPARVDPPPVHGLFRRAGVVEHLFGDIGPLLIRRRLFRPQTVRHALPAVEVKRSEGPKPEDRGAETGDGDR